MKHPFKAFLIVLLAYASGIAGMDKPVAAWELTKHAGIFPWTYYKENVVLLFGYDRDHMKCIDYKAKTYEPCPAYGDFGGHAESKESTAEVAAREANEETNNIYKFTAKSLAKTPYMESNNYRTYLKEVPYISQEILQKEASNSEITDFAWVKGSNLIAMLKDPTATTVRTISGDPITIKPVGLVFWRAANKSARRYYDGLPEEKGRATKLENHSPYDWLAWFIAEQEGKKREYDERKYERESYSYSYSYSD